ncbi:MAG: hypothetical protein N3F64_01850 [Nitrososphaeria archaeon]|nr:hypothetical protein [Nitrososphaeria archaeon]
MSNKHIIALLIIVSTFCLGINSVQALSPSQVKAGVWVISIDKVDLAAGTFSADFYLWFHYTDVPPNFEFINGVPSKIEKTVEREGYVEYRVKATFVQQYNFKSFPFDVQNLNIIIEDKSLNISKLVFSPDFEQSGLDPQAYVVGWQFKDFTSESIVHEYPGENYSRIIFTISIQRETFPVFMKNFVPITLITLISLLSFAVSIQNYSQRISIGITTLFSAVAYHLATLSTLPPLSYLTLFDRIMLAIYSLFLFNIGVSVQGMRLVDRKQVERAIVFEDRMQKLLPLVIIVLLIFFTIVIEPFT